jgi:hypothetical protein
MLFHSLIQKSQIDANNMVIIALGTGHLGCMGEEMAFKVDRKT